MKVINKTTNGQIVYCSTHDNYHFEFGNMFLHLNREELKFFCEYVVSLDYKHYFALNRNSVNIRKLLLNVGPNIMFSLNINEFLELKNLLSLQSNLLLENTAVINQELILS